MTKEKRRKIGLIAVLVMLAVLVINDFTINVFLVDALALLGVVAVAFVATALYIRDNAPLSQREMLKEFAPIILILILIGFAIPQML